MFSVCNSSLCTSSLRQVGRFWFKTDLYKRWWQQQNLKHGFVKAQAQTEGRSDWRKFIEPCPSSAGVRAFSSDLWQLISCHFHKECVNVLVGKEASRCQRLQWASWFFFLIAKGQQPIFLAGKLSTPLAAKNYEDPSGSCDQGLGWVFAWRPPWPQGEGTRDLWHTNVERRWIQANWLHK